MSHRNKNTRKEPKTAARATAGEYPLDPGTELVRFEGYEVPYRTAPFFLTKKTVAYSEEEDGTLKAAHGGDTHDLYNDDFLECDGEPEHPVLCGDAVEQGEAFSDEFTIEGVIYDAKTKMWKKSIYVPACFFGAIIGPSGSTLKGIQSDFSCKVAVPRKGQEGPIEVISYSSAMSVQNAIERIELKVIDNRAKKRFTHFVAIPTNETQIMNSYVKLRDTILNADQFSEDCKNPVIWYNPNKLHLTVSMLCLLDAHEEKLAAEVLSRAVDQAAIVLPANKPLTVHIRGLDIMGDDPGHTNVLYAKARCDQLQEFVDKIADAMLRSGLRPQGKDWDNRAKVKLHMTIANAKYTKNTDNHIYGFDVKEILKQFGTFEFGHLTLDKVVINMMKSPEDCYISTFEKTVRLGGL